MHPLPASPYVGAQLFARVDLILIEEDGNKASSRAFSGDHAKLRSLGFERFWRIADKGCANPRSFAGGEHSAWRRLGTGAALPSCAHYARRMGYNHTLLCCLPLDRDGPGEDAPVRPGLVTPQDR